MKKLTVADVEFIAFDLAKEWLGKYEPIPDFGTRFPNILEGCLVAPFQMFDQKSLYPGLVEKAAILFYFLIKNHPFQNGNKRIAMTTLLCFLYRNQKWLVVNDYKLYQFALQVAGSLPESKDAIVQDTARFIRTYITELR